MIQLHGRSFDFWPDHILHAKMAARPWGGKSRVKPSRYSGEKLRAIRSSGQHQEMARRKARIGQ